MSNSKIVADFIAAWEALDAAKIMSFFAKDAVYHNIPMDPMQGAETISGFITPFMTQAESIEFKVLFSAEAAGGTVLNERLDIIKLKNGQVMSVPVMGVFELKDGKITKWRDYFDAKMASPAS